MVEPIWCHARTIRCKRSRRPRRGCGRPSWSSLRRRNCADRRARARTARGRRRSAPGKRGRPGRAGRWRSRRGSGSALPPPGDQPGDGEPGRDECCPEGQKGRAARGGQTGCGPWLGPAAYDSRGDEGEIRARWEPLFSDPHRTRRPWRQNLVGPGSEGDPAPGQIANTAEGEALDPRARHRPRSGAQKQRELEVPDRRRRGALQLDLEPCILHLDARVEAPGQ